MHHREYGHVGNGALLLPAITAWPRNHRVNYYTIFGGPYTERPAAMRGAVAAEELCKLPHDVAMPVKDFKVPLHSSAREAVGQIVDLILKGEPVYVGCMAGRGRTGLLLSLVAKTFGLKAPVEYVRAEYYEHAVENKLQYDFVQAWQPDPKTQAKIRRARWLNLFKKGPNLTRVV